MGIDSRQSVQSTFKALQLNPPLFILILVLFPEPKHLPEPTDPATTVHRMALLHLVAFSDTGRGARPVLSDVSNLTSIVSKAWSAFPRGYEGAG